MRDEDVRAIEIDFTGLEISDMAGAVRVPLRGTTTVEGLSDTLVREWVPAMRCTKCGRSDYCKFVFQEGGERFPIEHVECGACAQALRLFVKSMFPRMLAGTAAKRQLYLDAAFHFTRFVYAAETRIGALIDEDMVEYWGTAGPILYRMLLPLRDMLDNLIRNLKDLPGFENGPGILLVEGEAERAFLSKLKESGSSWFVDLLVDVYSGRGNRRPRRIAMLLERYADDGYRVFMEGDADGGDISQVFGKLVEKGLVAHDRAFVFKHDFESSIPRRLLLSALQEMGFLANVDSDEFMEATERWSGSILQMLEREFSVSLDAKKVKLAVAVAELLNAQSWHRDVVFMDSELGKFLAFVFQVR